MNKRSKYLSLSCRHRIAGQRKTHSVINPFIKQQIEKGFAMYIYDFKFDDLSTIAYNHLRTHLHCYKNRRNFTS